jgi:hypothetical protein
MTFISILVIVLVALFGVGLTVAAFHMEKLIRWENRKLNSLADTLRTYREGLEEEQALATETVPVVAPLLPAEQQPSKGIAA